VEAKQIKNEAVMKIVFHFMNHWCESDRGIAITPCIYCRLDSIDGAKGFSFMITWMGFSIGPQIMWLTKDS